MRQEQLEDRPHQMHETHEKHRVTLTHGSGNSKENVGFSEVKKKGYDRNDGFYFFDQRRDYCIFCRKH